MRRAPPSIHRCRRCRRLTTACPPPAPLSQDVDFHPTERLLATGVIDGHLVLHSFSKEAKEQRHKVKASRCVTAASLAAAATLHPTTLRRASSLSSSPSPC